MPRHDTKRGPTTNQGTPGSSQSRAESFGFQSFSDSTRAQTSIDLALAVLIFFSAIGLLMVNAPTLFFPAEFADTNDRAVADRIADQMVNDVLTEPGTTGLSHDKVVAFSSDSEFDDLESKFGVGDDQVVEIRVFSTDDTPPKALDPDENPEATEDDGLYYVQRGTSPEQSGDSVTVTSSLDDKQVFIEVTVGR